MEHNCCPDLLWLIFCSTQFLGLISWTRSESNVPTFCSCWTKVVWFELSNKVQSNVPPVSYHLLYSVWRRVICSKFICSKNLLDTKILTARHRSSRWQKYMKLLENQKSMSYMSCRADAFFRPKCTTARIATAQQNHWKMLTARI